MASTTIVKVLTLLSVLQLACGHSFLTYPPTYNPKFQMRNCKGAECHHACPTKVRGAVVQNRNHPAAIWSRGQNVTVKWARNNHMHGMVRLSLVPVQKRMDRAWHERLAFYYGCFSQGKHKCKKNECGADKSGYVNSAMVRVPECLPNGNYVLGMVWFGGVHWPLSKGTFFSDYWSCAYVKIRGGVFGKAKAEYHAGDKKDDLQVDGKCMTAIDAPGVCSKYGCRGPAIYTIPKRFKGNNGSNAVTFGMVMEAM